MHTAEHVLVRVHTDDGVVGVAEAPPRPFTYGETQAGIVAVITQIFAPALVGLTAHRTRGGPARGWSARSATRPPSPPSTWRSGTRWADPRSFPSPNLLGGYTDRMRVCHMLGFDEPAAMVAEAERMRTTYGITTFKVKVGRRPYTLDTAVVRALRERFGDDIELYVDGNRGWTASESAAGHGEMARPRPALRRGALPGRRCARPPLAGRTARTYPFIADESVPTPADVTREVLGRSATAISIKTARTGFTTSPARSTTSAEGLGLEVVMGNQIDGQLGIACAVAFGAAYQLTSRRAGELSNFLDMTDDLLTEPLRDPRRRAHGPPGAGLGIDDRRRQTRPLPHRPTLNLPRTHRGEQ